MQGKLNRGTEDTARRGAALVPTLVVVSTLVVFTLALVTMGLSGARSVNHHEDDYRLSSAVETAGIMAAEKLWTGFLQAQGGASGKISEFQAYLTTLGIEDQHGIDLPPEPGQGFDLVAMADVPGDFGSPEFNDVNIDALEVVRIDDESATRLYVTVSASTKRGENIVNPVLNRALQQVYTIEPEDFAGFNYGILANNVNCVFCHTQVDRVERFYNEDPGAYGDFERVKVGTLESLMVRHDMIDGNSSVINDFDADSYVAGTVYVRGGATDHAGDPIADWSDLTFGSFAFDALDGKLFQDEWGEMTPVAFEPATGNPQPKGENLYLDYPWEYADMPDGNLPQHFPPPFPDDGGVDPATGVPTTAGASNKVVDPEEFHAVAKTAEGAITAGVIHVPDEVIDDVDDYHDALFVGNEPSLQQSVQGNVVLSGTLDEPITIDGTVAIDGDLVINGYVKGSGSLVVSGNVYVPTNLQYADDVDPETGTRIFGMSGGQENKLGLAAGGSILIGDYQRSATLQWDWSVDPPGQYEIISGNPTADGAQVGEWSFVLAELSLFNRGEWAKTQPVLPGPGEADLPPTQWTASNLPEDGGTYEPGYMPRYYQYGPDDVVPIYNHGPTLYWDEHKSSWITDEWTEVPLGWLPELLTNADPGDPNDDILYEPDGTPKAVVSQLTPHGGWITDEMYKMSVEFFESQHPVGTPMAIDGLLYTNNAIFGLVNKNTPMQGQMIVNGALVCADLGLLVPSKKHPGGVGAEGTIPGSPFRVGLQLNYDERVRTALNVINPNLVTIKRTLWNPTANLL